MDMSLDEIIAKTRANKKGRGGDSSFKSDSVSGRRSGGGGGRTGGSRTGGAFTKSVPGGKWRHDKFAENESGGRGGSGGHSSSPRGGALASAVNANKKVRVNVSNLAPSVTTADLEELFAPYSIDSAACHYGETGDHLGTGDVVMKKSQALKALEDFKGVSVDGSRLVLAIVDGGVGRESIFDRVQIAKVGGGGISKKPRFDPIGRGGAGGRRSGGDRGDRKASGGGRHPLDRFDEDAPKGGRGGGRGGAAGGRGGKKQLTEEELDAELNAYMKKPAMEH